MNPLLKFLLQFFLLFAEEDSDGRLLPFLLDISVIVVYVHLHLTEVLMSEFVNLYVDEDIALQKTVIEDQIYIVVFFVKCESLLSGLKEESLSKFKEELLHLTDDLSFQFTFGVCCFWFESKEFKSNRILDYVCRFLDHLTFRCQTHYFGFVFAEGEAFVETTVHLALQPTDAPVLLCTFDLIETAGIGIFDTHENKVMRP